jgi:integrase
LVIQGPKIVVRSLVPPQIRSASSWAVTALSHDLRHTCATLLLGRGVHPKLVQHLLGHASIAMTLDRYSHWIPSMGRHAADGMDEALG